MSVFNKIISFFCGDNIDKIRIRESTVMRNNQVHKIKDATGLSVRHISRIINHTKAVDVR